MITWLGFLVWDISLGNFGLEAFAEDLWLAIFRLGSFPRYLLVESFGSRSLVGIFGFGPFAQDLAPLSPSARDEDL